jgi:hypothetical protein
MTLSKGLARFGLVAAVAAIMFSVSMFAADTVSAQNPPATVYGKGLKAGDKVEARIGGTACGSATANAAGEWSISIPTTAPCNPTAGAAISFTLNGNAVTSTPAATWQAGGLPGDVANGYVLTAAQATATPTATVAAPKTGNAGLLGGDSAASSWVVAMIALVALGTVVGTRAYAGRTR